MNHKVGKVFIQVININKSYWKCRANAKEKAGYSIEQKRQVTALFRKSSEPIYFPYKVDEVSKWTISM